MAFDPIPVPVRGSATFNADAEAFALGISQFAEDYNALSSVINASLTSTSTTSLTIGTGGKTLTVQTGLGYLIGHPLRIANTADPTNFMDGIVTAYNTGTGSLTVNVLSVGGSGTFSSWNTMVLPGVGNFASLSYNKFTARQVLANEVTIASASTVDFTTGDSNQFLITGTTTITAVTMEQGAVIKARFAAACQLTHGTNLQIQGGENYTTSAGDIVTFTSNGTVVLAEISKADGRPINLTVINSTNDPTYTSTSGTEPASPAWVNGRFSELMSGIVFDWPGSTAPPGAMALPLVPTNVSRTTYARWFAMFGTQFGVGNGSTTFGMPYCPANFAIIQANGNVGSSTSGQMPAHSHSLPNSSAGSSGVFSMLPSSTPNSTTSSGAAGSGSNNLAAGIRMLKCIWL